MSFKAILIRNGGVRPAPRARRRRASNKTISGAAYGSVASGKANTQTVDAVGFGCSISGVN